MSKAERFWIKFILRLAFGFLFLIAALNIFSYGGPNDFGPDAFAKGLAGGFQSTWLGGVFAWIAGALPKSWSSVSQVIREFPYYFMYGMPFVFAVLSVPILTGIWLRPALRLGAIYLVLLGLGKYISTPTDLSTTAADFLFALLICFGLYFLGQEAKEKEAELEQVTI